MQYAVCSVHCEVCSVQGLLFSVQCSVPKLERVVSKVQSNFDLQSLQGEFPRWGAWNRHIGDIDQRALGNAPDMQNLKIFTRSEFFLPKCYPK